MAPDLALVVGLGNPGPRYGSTRHNIGFRVADELSARYNVDLAPVPGGLCGRLPDRGWLAKPGLYMNRSGEATAALLAALDLAPDRLLVVVDDVDLPLGSLRLRPAGGPGTHNGLRDLVDHLGPGFARLRIGVRGAEPADDLAAYVLSDFAAGEQEAVAVAVRLAADAVECALSDGVAVAMNRFNRRPAADAPDPAPGVRDNAIETGPTSPPER